MRGPLDRCRERALVPEKMGSDCKDCEGRRASPRDRATTGRSNDIAGGLAYFHCVAKRPERRQRVRNRHGKGIGTCSQADLPHAPVVMRHRERYGRRQRELRPGRSASEAPCWLWRARPRAMISDAHGERSRAPPGVHNSSADYGERRREAFTMAGTNVVMRRSRSAHL